MSPETLERLLIDRQLGELPPDVRELVDAYVAQNATSAELQSDIQDTLDFARQAMQRAGGDTTGALPPFSRKPILSARIGRGHSGDWARKTALAAAITLAFFLGTRLNSTPSPPIQLAVTENSLDRSPADGFWTLSKLARTTSRFARHDHRINWSAPLSPLWKGERS